MLDPRGPRFSAAVTAVVLIAVLSTAIVSTDLAGWIAAVQAVIFGIGAASARFAPYGLFYRATLARRLGPPAYREPPGPVRFSQGVGFVFASVAAIGFLAGLSVVGYVAAGAALLAAGLNATIGLCLACKIYPFVNLYVIRRKPQAQGAHL